MQNVGADAKDHLSRAKLSVFVISYNRKALISACLAPLSFADELIVIDKSSTDGTAEIATRYAHRVITVPWSPTVEDTRAFALSQCTHDWILALDDDECLSEEAVAFIEQELLAPRAEIYGIAQRHYILGIHDERAYYWPEFQPRLFQRGAVDFVPTVHGGYVFHSACRYDVPPDEGVCVHHLSHGDVSEWVEKTNRYTSMPDRLRVDRTCDDLIQFAHERIDFWGRQTRDPTPGDYPNAVALLRATYDMIDRLKVWEEEKGLDGRAGAAQFRRGPCGPLRQFRPQCRPQRDRGPGRGAIEPACRRAGGRGSGATQRPGESRGCPGRGRGSASRRRGCPGYGRDGAGQSRGGTGRRRRSEECGAHTTCQCGRGDGTDARVHVLARHGPAARVCQPASALRPGGPGVHRAPSVVGARCDPAGPQCRGGSPRCGRSCGARRWLPPQPTTQDAYARPVPIQPRGSTSAIRWNGWRCTGT